MSEEKNNDVRLISNTIVLLATIQIFLEGSIGNRFPNDCRPRFFINASMHSKTMLECFCSKFRIFFEVAISKNLTK